MEKKKGGMKPFYVCTVPETFKFTAQFALVDAKWLGKVKSRLS